MQKKFQLFPKLEGSDCQSFILTGEVIDSVDQNILAKFIESSLKTSPSNEDPREANDIAQLSNLRLIPKGSGTFHLNVAIKPQIVEQFEIKLPAVLAAQNSKAVENAKRICNVPFKDIVLASNNMRTRIIVYNRNMDAVKSKPLNASSIAFGLSPLILLIFGITLGFRLSRTKI